MVDYTSIIIDLASCLSCVACPPVCHSEALQLHGLELELNYQLCDNCFICIAACPVGAISKSNNDFRASSIENK